MFGSTLQDELEYLKKNVRADILTPAKEIDDDTWICMKVGNTFTQGPFKAIPETAKKEFLKKKVGDTIEGKNIKILAIYDIWDEMKD